MAGEFTSGNTPEKTAAKDTSFSGDSEKGYGTDVEGVRAEDQINVGKDTFPCFDVGAADFNQNMQFGRKRIRFKTGTPAQSYMKGTKYNRPFYIKHTTEKGKQYVRRIK